MKRETSHSEADHVRRVDPRRALAESALLDRDIASLSNREIARLLRVGLYVVRWTRRRLESQGRIPVVTRRLSRRGTMIDIEQIGSACRKYPEARWSAPLWGVSGPRLRP